MEKTAVEWLFENLYNKDTINDCTVRAFEQAKEMGRQQKYSIQFIEWYSGMTQAQIAKAHDRFLKENF